MADSNKKEGVSVNVFVSTAVLFLCIGFLAGSLIVYERFLPSRCDGYLIGSIFGYECYDDSIVGVCLTPNGSLTYSNGAVWTLEEDLVAD